MERYEKFTFLIASVSRNIRRIKTEEMARWDLKSHHVSCIYYLYANKSLTLTKLCKVCNEDKANISRSVDYLEENGFVTHSGDPSKKYRSPYMLTEKGKELGKSLKERIDQTLSDASLGISDEDRRIMYDCLERINDNLCNLANEYKKENGK